MKKHLFLVSAMLMLSAASFAQWTSPTPQKAAIDLEGGDQYFYNVEYGGFLVGANDWGTRASVARDKGLVINVTEVGEGVYKMGAFSPDATDGVWIDGSRDGNETFTFTVNDADQTFTIGTTKFEGTFLTWTGEESNTRVNFTEDKTNGTWYAVTVEEYNALLPKLEAYNASLNLKAAIEAAEKDYPNVDITAQKAVYADTNSTAAQLNAAKEEIDEAIKKAIAEEAANGASVDNPKDMTGMIVNPTFDGITYEGWEGSKFGSGGSVGPCAERYEMTFDTYQIITGLPNGVYRVTVDGFHRWGSTGNAFETKGQTTPARLYGANGADAADIMTAPIMGLFDGISPEQPVEGTSFTYTDSEGNTYYIPNSMADACAFFDAGYYQPTEKNNTVYFGVTDGVARIGVKKDVNIGADWTLVDDFTLTYYGQGADAYTLWNEGIKNSFKDYSVLEEQGVTVTSSYIEAYDAVKATIEQGATDHANVIANMKALSDAEAAIEANIAAWKELKAEQALCQEKVGDLYGVDAEVLGDYLDNDLPELFDNCELSTEEVLEKVQELKAMLDKAVENGLQPNSDVTNLIKNASFKEGFANWTKADGSAVAGTPGGLNAYPCVEVYSNVVDVQQVVTGLPKGVYRLDCKAFERPSGNGTFTGEEPSKVYLFMNNVETPVQNIMKDGMPEEEAVNYENCFIEGPVGESYKDTPGTTGTDYFTDYGTYIPNGMSGASYAFRAGRYNQSATGLVTDGKMTIGLTSKGQTAHWVLWSSFNLTYLGMTTDVVKPELDKMVESIVIDTETLYGVDIKEALIAAIAAVDNAKTGSEMMECLDKLSVLKSQQTASLATFAELNELLENAPDAIDSDEKYGEVPVEKKQDVLNLIGTISNGIDSYTEAEAQQAIKDINDALARILVPANIGDATVDKPVELTCLIANPSFEEDGVGGWTNSGSIAVQSQTNAAFYKTENTYAERWHANGTLDIHQTIPSNLELPEGWYKIVVDVYSQIEDATLYINDTEYVYGITDGDAAADHFEASVVAHIPAATDMVIGAKGTLTASTWFCIDNFRLYYYGNDGEPGGIEDIIDNSKKSSAIYDINGVKLATLRKGINIVRTADGKVVKIIKK